MMNFWSICKKYGELFAVIIVTGYLTNMFDRGPAKAWNEILDWLTDEDFWMVVFVSLLALILVNFLAAGIKAVKEDFRKRLSSKGKEVKA